MLSCFVCVEPPGATPDATTVFRSDFPPRSDTGAGGEGIDSERCNQQENGPDPLHPKDVKSTGVSSSTRLLGASKPGEYGEYAKEAFLSCRVATNKSPINAKPAEVKHLWNADEGMKVLIGPMPVEKFLDEFLPAVNENGMPDCAGAFGSVPAVTKDDEEVCSSLVRVIS